MKLLEIAGAGAMKIATTVANRLILALEKHLPNAGNNDIDISYIAAEDSVYHVPTITVHAAHAITGGEVDGSVQWFMENVHQIAQRVCPPDSVLPVEIQVSKNQSPPTIFLEIQVRPK